MAAGIYNFTLEQGATFTRQITWQDSAGAGIDITNYTLAGKIRRRASDQNELISFTLTKVTAASGIFTFSLTATQTATLPAGVECVYDIEATTGSTVYRVLQGTCTISAEVTK